jgi:hypothetical protein
MGWESRGLDSEKEDGGLSAPNVFDQKILWGTSSIEGSEFGKSSCVTPIGDHV